MTLVGSIPSGVAPGMGTALCSRPCLRGQRDGPGCGGFLSIPAPGLAFSSLIVLISSTLSARGAEAVVPQMAPTPHVPPLHPAEESFPKDTQLPKQDTFIDKCNSYRPRVTGREGAWPAGGPGGRGLAGQGTGAPPLPPGAHAKSSPGNPKLALFTRNRLYLHSRPPGSRSRGPALTPGPLPLPPPHRPPPLPTLAGVGVPSGTGSLPGPRGGGSLVAPIPPDGAGGGGAGGRAPRGAGAGKWGLTHSSSCRSW